MNSSGTMRIQFTGAVDVDIDGASRGTGLLPASPGGTALASPLTITGRVVNANTGYPLPGLRVAAVYAPPPEETDPAGRSSNGAEESLLGSDVSQEDGRFNIQFEDRRSVREKICALEGLADPALILTVEQTGGELLYRSERLAPSGTLLEASLPVELPAIQISPADWDELCPRLKDARIAQVNGLAALLMAPPDGGGPLNGWDLEKRQAALAELEAAFLDPSGILRSAAGPLPGLAALQAPGALEALEEKLQPQMGNPEVQAAWSKLGGKTQAFANLQEVDWVMDLDAFGTGDVAQALNGNIDLYRGAFETGIGIFPKHTSDLIRYRDYLREIWIAAATRIVYIQPHQLNAAQALQQLETRFHQSFTTTDEAEKPANEVLIPILLEILQAPTGSGWGFGILPAGINPRDAKPAREYLDYLIGLTGYKSDELDLRYRLDLQRPDGALSSRVQENIATLQGFFRDSFQCEAEPFHVDPDVHDQPIIPSKLQGKAPFFLWYEEWLRQQQKFYPENFYDIRAALPSSLSQESQDNLKRYLNDATNANKVDEAADWKFISQVYEIYRLLAQGHGQYYSGEYGLALDSYEKARFIMHSAVQSKIFTSYDLKSGLAKRKALPADKIGDLQAFTDPVAYRTGVDFQYRMIERDRLAFKLGYYAIYTLPVCLGDTHLALGNYEKAVFYYGLTTRFRAGIAKESDSGATKSDGYRPYHIQDFIQLYHKGDRPYTVELSEESYYPAEGDDGSFYNTTYYDAIEKLQNDFVPQYTHKMEAKFFRLRLANAMLEWADSLYRTDEVESIQRAREMYKGALFLHGENPPICPTWEQYFLFDFPNFLSHRENPALSLQKNRARQGFFKVESGVNYYGERDDLVPVLRYRPLKDSADRFAALARTAQADFLLYMEKMETALIERMKLSNLLQKATLQSQIAGEQIQIAEHNVVVAQDQVTQVREAIAAKIKEMEEASSFFNQLGSFLGGMVKTFTSLPGDTQSAVKAGFASEMTGKALVGEGMLGLGAGASIMAGFGIFAVAGYMSMSSMADAYNRQGADLATLRDKALPAAERAVVARQREVTISAYAKSIAQADIDLARDLITFQDNRFLNVNFWSNLAQIARRLLRRYIELGARVAWLAERALAYEQDRPVDIIRMDYYPEKLRGVSGADLLASDLAELEATRIEGIRRSTPVKITLSLARDYPLQFGQLKQSGRCSFRTAELPLRIAYPGTSGYRIRAVSATASQTTIGSPLRGILVNQGVSLSRPGQPEERVLVRPAEGMPLSEFRLENDMGVYSLPDETLLTFEGSGVETFWELNFPAPANPYGLEGLSDVLITLNLRAEYSQDLYTKGINSQPKTARRWALVSAAQYAPEAVKDLAGNAGIVDIDFDLGKVGLPKMEKNRKVKNLALALVSPAEIDADAALSAAQPAADVSFTFKNGIALSNIPPSTTDPVPPPLPLNALFDFDVDQVFRLSIDKNANPGADFSEVKDVVLAVEYAADLA